MSRIASIKISSGQIRTILWITLAWTFISFLQFLTGLSILRQVGCDFDSTSQMIFFRASIFTGLIAGVIGGSVLVLLWESWLRGKNYGRALFNIFLSYSLIFLIISFLTIIFFYNLQTRFELTDISLWEHISAQIFAPARRFAFFFWLLVVLGTLILLQVNDKYGPGVFRDFLLGKYFQPKREERIFMFLDLRSSTSIAEKLGEERYFNFINEVFKFVTPGILNTKGEIYQYVGDEIVISWRMERGMENANCIRCFFAIQTILKQKAAYFEKEYGIIPEFKAGVHYGHVMAGEVGLVKRDIAFSGDVLNTTARIQSKCNEMGVNLLFSKHLLDKLRLPPDTYLPRKIGDMLLRGKQQQVVLYTI